VNAVVDLQQTLYAFSAKDLTEKGEGKRYPKRMYIKERQIEVGWRSSLAPRPTAGGESIEKTSPGAGKLTTFPSTEARSGSTELIPTRRSGNIPNLCCTAKWAALRVLTGPR